MVASCTSVRVESSGVVVEGLFRAMISRAQLSTDTILKLIIVPETGNARPKCAGSLCGNTKTIADIIYLGLRQ